MRLWSRFIVIMTFGIMLSMFGGGAQCATIYVNRATGDDNNSGSSWQLAKKTVRAAVTISTSDDEIWVAAGTYGPVYINNGGRIYGGFAGNEAVRTQRNIAANPTTLTLVVGEPYGSSIVTVASSASSVVIDGFTVKGSETGVWIYLSPDVTIASNKICNLRNGIYCSGSDPTIAGNIIAGNSGGGIVCYDASPTVTNNTITANDATNGGAISCDGYSSPIVANNIIAHNSSGVYCYREGGTYRNNVMWNPDGYEYWYSGSGGAPSSLLPGSDNVYADPKLASNEYGDTHIMPDSPCRNIGWSGAGGIPAIDIDGQARIQGGTVDIGADESDGTQWTVAPMVVRVSREGNDANDGSTWALAKQTVQAGIDVVAPHGGEVWVSRGTYPERIVLKSYAYVYGGFQGTESSRSQRDFSANPTILDGSNTAGSVVVIETGGHRMTSIDGFTITGGTGTFRPYNYGGTYVDTFGGGIYCAASPTIANNKIISCSADIGGGIYVDCGSPYIVSNLISANSAGLHGGGLYAGYCWLNARNNRMSGNEAVGRGGAACLENSYGVLCHNAIVGNGADDGGGVYTASYVDITNNTIAGNGALYGGGIHHRESNSAITNNTIVANTAAYGGGVYFAEIPDGLLRPGGWGGNNIIAYNSSGVAAGIPPAWQITVIWRNNLIYNPDGHNYSGWWAQSGDLFVPPKLASNEYGNLHIQADSPCRNAGSIGAYGIPTADLDGQARIQEGTVDIGADESDGTQWMATPMIVRVRSDGNDSNDGSTWALAKKTVQAGIDRASLYGGEVWIRSGNYPEMIKLSTYAHVYGGFAGTESSRIQRAFNANPTILDGKGAGSVVTSKNSGHKLSTVDGLTIVNGLAPYGGGICCVRTSPTISNTVVRNNTCTGSGAGVYCSHGLPDITNCTIASNMGGYGVYLTDSSPSISNSIVAFNSHGIYSNAGSPVLRNNDVYNPGGMDYSGLAAGSGDIRADPVFLDRAAGDCHITASSLCIDSGQNAYVGLDWRDTDGEPRIFGGTVDIGADEYQGVAVAAMPSFAPDGGEYSSAQYVVVSCMTPGAVVHYTTDGSDPTQSDPVPSAPIAIDNSLILKARAFKVGEQPSTIKSADYILKVPSPCFSPDGGTYPLPQNVSISCSITDAVIHYTTNGLDPTESDPVVTGPVLVDSSMALKASAWKGGWITSDVKNATYIESGDLSYVIKATTYNWVDPTGHTALILTDDSISPVQTMPFPFKYYGIAYTHIYVGDNGLVGFVSSGLDHFANTDIPRTGVPNAAIYAYWDDLWPQKGGSILIGTTGSSPNRRLIVSWVDVPRNSSSLGLTFQAILCEGSNDIIFQYKEVRPGSSSGAGRSATIGIENAWGEIAAKYSYNGSTLLSNDQAILFTTSIVADPVMTPGGGVYYAAANVSVTSATPGCVIHYTTNGLDPTEEDPVVNGPVLVDRNLTLKAKAWKTGKTTSGVTGADYTMGGTVATPVLSPDGGAYMSSQNVTISSATPGAAVHYTTNGIDPTESDPVYSNPLFVDRSLTLKAAAWKIDWVPSSTAAAVYALGVQTPTLTPDGGVYTSSQNVAIDCSTPGATIHYTTNGIDPTENDAVYVAPVLVDTSLTLKAQAWKTDWDPSAVKSGGYTIGWSVGDVKRLANETPVAIVGAVVSAAFPQWFYVEADDRSSGIRVDKLGHSLVVGMRADIVGVMKTTNGERYVAATSAVQSSPPENTGSIATLGIGNRDLGGSDWNYNPSTGAGQMGVKGNFNLNNVGLLVTTTGQVTYNPSGSYFVITDGSSVIDQSGYRGIRVTIPTGVTKPAAGQYVTVTGVSSIFKSGAFYYPLIRVRTQADILLVE